MRRKDEVEECVRTTGPLVDFFHRPAASDGDAGCDNLTARQRRDAICGVVRGSKFHRARARWLFSGLGPPLRRVVEEEGYNPTNLPDDEGEDGAEENEFDTEEASRSIVFLRCCYLDGLLARPPNGGRGGRRGRRKIGVIDEAFEVAELLHDSLFPLQNSGRPGPSPPSSPRARSGGTGGSRTGSSSSRSWCRCCSSGAWNPARSVATSSGCGAYGRCGRTSCGRRICTAPCGRRSRGRGGAC